MKIEYDVLFTGTGISIASISVNYRFPLFFVRKSVAVILSLATALRTSCRNLEIRSSCLADEFLRLLPLPAASLRRETDEV